MPNTEYTHTCTLLAHVYTPNTCAHSTCPAHTRDTLSTCTHIVHRFSTHITRACSSHTDVHTCRHAQHTHVHSTYLRTHTRTRSVHVRHHPPHMTGLQRSVQDGSDSDSFHCQMDPCLHFHPGVSHTLKTPRSGSCHKTRGTK